VKNLFCGRLTKTERIAKEIRHIRLYSVGSPGFSRENAPATCEMQELHSDKLTSPAESPNASESSARVRVTSSQHQHPTPTTNRNVMPTTIHITMGTSSPAPHPGGEEKRSGKPN